MILHSFRCRLVWATFVLGAAFLDAAEPTPAQPFVAGLSPQEQAAIGVAAMSPAQIAALEAAVERYVAGRSETAVAVATAEVRSELVEKITEREKELTETKQALAAQEAKLEAHVEQAKSREEQDGRSLLERAKVLLRPGTHVEYTTLESRLLDPFKGWTVGTLFRLENGQTWKVIQGKYWSPAEDAGKAVTIEPGALGSFFIRIEGMKQTPRVILVGEN